VKRCSTIVVAALVLLAVPSVAAAVTPGAVLDQSAAVNSCNSIVNNTQSLSETFTAGLTGQLTDVVLTLFNTSANSPLHVAITDSTSGAPGSTVLAAVDVPTTAVGATDTDYDVAFPSPPDVVAGTTYAITVTSTGTGFWLWECSLDDYAGGQFYYNNGGVGSWTGQSFADSAFATYVLVPPPPGTGRAGYCAAAGDTWANGAVIPAGTFLNLATGQPSADSHYAGATPAIYLQGEGISCDAPPPGWKQDGYAGSGGPSEQPDAIYPYFTPGG
jgi:hypothetical protein